jgi:hypothetical protein
MVSFSPKSGIKREEEKFSIFKAASQSLSTPWSTASENIIQYLRASCSATAAMRSKDPLGWFKMPCFRITAAKVHLVRVSTPYLCFVARTTTDTPPRSSNRNLAASRERSRHRFVIAVGTPRFNAFSLSDAVTMDESGTGYPAMKQ